MVSDNNSEGREHCNNYTNPGSPGIIRPHTEEKIESYISCLHSEQECHELIYMARAGHIGRVRRRLNENEKSKIRPGSIFVYKEQESGIRRWTDKREWTPSRVQGIFLVYKDLNGPLIKKTYAYNMKDGRYHIVAYTHTDWENGAKCCGYFKPYLKERANAYDRMTAGLSDLGDSPDLIVKHEKGSNPAVGVNSNDMSSYMRVPSTKRTNRIFIAKDEIDPYNTYAQPYTRFQEQGQGPGRAGSMFEHSYLHNSNSSDQPYIMPENYYCGPSRYGYYTQTMSSFDLASTTGLNSSEPRNLFFNQQERPSEEEKRFNGFGSDKFPEKPEDSDSVESVESSTVVRDLN